MPLLESERWQLDDLTIDVGSQSVTRNGQPIPLPQLSFNFLLALIRSAPNVLSTDELMDQVWKGIFVNAETVKQRAKLLRDALQDDPRSPRYFTTRRSIGYQLLAQPVRVESADPAQTHHEIRRTKTFWLVAAAALVALPALGGLTSAVFGPTREQAVQARALRVAVLPFDNLSGDPADAFIARSIPEMVLNRLASIDGLTVIARESSLISGASRKSPKDAAAELDAGYVVKGSVQRTANTLRVTCFVIDTSRDVRLWSKQFDWPVDRLYALQDRIADQVAVSLERQTQGIGKLVPAVVATRNTDAYLAFLKGKSLLGRFTVAETDAAAVQFERAIKLDPEFASASIALYDARMQGASLRKDDMEPLRVRYRPLLDKALKLEPNSGEALFASAMWSGAPAAERIRIFRRAAELDPSNARGLTAFAELLEWSSTTRESPVQPEADRVMVRVLSIDPLSARAHFWAVQRQIGKLTPLQIEQEQKRALELDPQNSLLANRYALRRWMFHGETAEAIERMEKVIAIDPQNPWSPHLTTYFYLDVGDIAAARALAASTPASRDSTKAALAQFVGDWRLAGRAALGPRSFLFNQYENWLWSESVRDYALQTGQFDRAAELIATRYGFDLRNPVVTNLQQTTAAIALAHVLLASGKTDTANRLLGNTISWIDRRPMLGLVGVGRVKASALMLLGEREQALSLLTATVEAGRDMRFWWYVIDRDPVWAPARRDARFKVIAASFRKAAHVQRAKLDALRRAGRVPTRATRA